MKKPKSEKEMRRNIIYHAKLLGVDGEAIKIFERYDNLLRNCTNEQEKFQIQVMGNAELHKLLQCWGPLIVNGIEILPSNPNHKEDDDL